MLHLRSIDRSNSNACSRWNINAILGFSVSDLSRGTPLEAEEIAVLSFESENLDSLVIKLEVVWLIGLPEIQNLVYEDQYRQGW